MKTKQIINVLLTLFLLSGFIKVNAQETRNKEMTPYEIKAKKNKEIAKNLQGVFKTMHENATLNEYKSKGLCKPEDLVSIANISELEISPIRALYVVKDIKSIYLEDTSSLKLSAEGILNKGGFNSIEDRRLNAYNTTKNFKDYVHAFTGKDIGEIDGETEDIYEFKVKDIDKIREHYDFFKNNFDQTFIIVHDSFMSLKCEVTKTSRIKMKNFNYPNITWIVSTYLYVDCDCMIDGQPTDVKRGTFIYSAETTGLITSSTITFGSPKNAKIDVLTLECCPSEEKEEEVSYIEPIKQPDQTIGYTAGIGFSNDFEEVSYCAGVEYLKRISDKKSDTYLGGGVSYGGTSFNGFKTSTIMIGPKIQIHTPITPSGETQWVNGIKGYYSFGNRKNNGYTDKTTGIEASIYSGFNIQINKKTSIGIEFPVFTWEKIKIKPENGNDYEVDGTSLLLNKGNPLKLSLRHRF